MLILAGTGFVTFLGDDFEFGEGPVKAELVPGPVRAELLLELFGEGFNGVVLPLKLDAE